MATVGEYRIEHKLAGGATAEVWRGTGGTGRPVALKIFTGPAGPALELARREAAFASEVDHPHLVEVLDLVVEGDTVALVSALAGGGSLADLLSRRGQLGVGETLTVLVPIASVLATAHEREIVHADLSPANILFDQAGRPTLGDLGAARAAIDLGSPVSATPAYVAPEVARGAPPTPAADLFALGAVALHCLIGRPAWNADDLRDVVVQSTVGQWPDPGGIEPPRLSKLIADLLSADPGERPGAAAVVMELRRVGQPAPVDLAPELAVERDHPVTRLRADAVRSAPPAPQVGRFRARLPRARQARHRAILRPRARPLVIGAAVIVLGAGAVVTGLWWAGTDRAAPTQLAAVQPNAAPLPPGPPSTSGGPGTSPAGVRATAAGESGPTAPDPTRSRAPADRSVPIDWARVVDDLDASRAAALVLRDARMLDAVYTPGSSAALADSRTIATLRSDSHRVSGAAHVVRSVRIVRRTAEGVIVEVVDRLPSYEISDGTGTIIGRTGERADQRRLLTLVRTAGGYRISRVQPG